MEKLIINVLEWAKVRGILAPDNARNQLLKLYEEAGELAGAELKNNHIKIIDGIGDCLVVLAIYAHQKGLTLEECLNFAYNEIKDREGKTINGTFIKD